MSWKCAKCGNVNLDTKIICDSCNEYFERSVAAATEECDELKGTEKQACKFTIDYANPFRRFAVCIIDILKKTSK